MRRLIIATLAAALLVPVPAMAQGPTLWCIATTEATDDVVAYIDEGGLAVVVPLSSCDPEAEDAEVVDHVGFDEWTEHQEDFRARVGRIAERVAGRSSPRALGRAIGSLTVAVRDEARWVSQNRDRFEPSSCYADELARWERHLDSGVAALRSVRTSVRRADFSAMLRGTRRFVDAYQRMIEVYSQGEDCG